MKLFLASALEQVKDLFVEKFWNIDGKTIWFISNPADLDRKWDMEPWWVSGDKEMLESLWWKIHNIDIRNTKNKELFEIVRKLDFLYVSWWNTRYFKELADQSWFQKIVDELISTWKIIYISTSAWSCIMWTSIKYMDPGDFKIEKWYGIVNAMILPHRWSEHFKQEYEETMPKIYNDNQNIITLSDDQTLFVDDKWMIIL